MPKIRGVKPDYWTDEDIVDLTIPARLLFIGLWSYACDNGHLQDKPKQIKMRLLPGDDVNCSELLRELEDGGRIRRVDGWITIPNFTKHQKPDKRYFQHCEAPGCKPNEGDSQPETRGANHETTPRPQRALAVVSPGTPGDGDGDGEVKVTTSSASADAEFEKWWSRYPRKVGKGAAAKAYRAARKKADADTLGEAMVAQTPVLMKDGLDYCPHASTWLNAERWADEVQPQRAVPPDWMNP